MTEWEKITVAAKGGEGGRGQMNVAAAGGTENKRKREKWRLPQAISKKEPVTGTDEGRVALGGSTVRSRHPEARTIDREEGKKKNPIEMAPCKSGCTS